MSTTPYDNLLRYHVQSASRPQVQHLVDLDLYDGNGACSCEHFTFKLEPHLKNGARSPTGGLRCRHIKEARERLADDVVRQVAKGSALHFNGKVNVPKVGVPAPIIFGTAKDKLARKLPQPRKKAGRPRVRRA